MKSQVAESFYKLLFNNTSDGILLVDLKTQKFHMANSAICKKLGYSLKEIKNLGVADIHPKKDLPYVMEQFARQARGRIGENILAKDLPIKRKDNSVFYADVSAARMKLAGKMYLGGIFRDVTDRKQVEKGLVNAGKASQNVFEDLSIEKSKVEAAKAKDEAMLASIGDGIIAIDTDRRIVVMNTVAEKLLGWKIDETLGKLYTDVIFLEDEKGVVPLEERPLAKAFTSSFSSSSNLYIRSKNKNKIPVTITVSPIILDNKIIGAIEVFRDITKEKEIDKAKTEFVSLASHQLRGPLTTISWYTEMILKGDVGRIIPGQKKYLEKIYQGDQQMIGLVNTLLNVSRIELGTFTAKLEPTDIITLAQSVLDEQKPEIEKKKLIVKEDFGKDVPRLSADPKFLRIVFQNLFSNSVEYTPPGGKIELAISLESKKTVLIKVSDTGYGIPKNQQDKIFTKLFRADNVRNKEIAGTGLGLYLTKSIVEDSGGKIWFESEENKGTCFYVTLPLTMPIVGRSSSKS